MDGYEDIIRYIIRLGSFVEVTSFYDPDVDKAITSGLVSTLRGVNI